MTLPEPPPIPFKLAYSVKEAAALLPIGDKSVYELLRSGELRSFKVGVQYVIPHVEIERWLERNTRQAALELDALHAKYERV